jgi:predicted DNA-binding transcriptional regulator AlpA
MAAKKFPKPVPLNQDGDSGAVGWIDAEIIDWQKQRIKRRDTAKSRKRRASRAA